MSTPADVMIACSARWPSFQTSMHDPIARVRRRGASGVARSLRVHDLRPTSTALMIANGAPIKAVAERLGHSSPTVTLNTYSHVQSEIEGRLRLTDALDAAFRAVAHSVPPAADSGSGSSVRRMSKKRR